MKKQLKEKEMKFKEVSKRNRCEICGKDSWCAFDVYKDYFICRRIQLPEAKVKTDVNGNEYYIYKRRN